MAVFAFTNAYFVFNSVNLSDHIKSIVVTFDGAVLDSTAMSDSWTENIMGLKSGSFAVTFNDDYASGSVDATLWAAFNAGAVVPYEFRPDAGAVSATNPKWTGNLLPSGHAAGGGVGDLASKSLTFPTSGAATRATS